MVRYAVGYRSRAFVTFGQPIPLDGVEAESRTVGAGPEPHGDGARRAADTRCCRRPVIAAAMRPSNHAAELENRVDGDARSRCVPAAPTSAWTRRPRPSPAVEPLEARGIMAVSDGRVRVRERNVLRYYARGIDHLLPRRARRAR